MPEVRDREERPRAKLVTGLSRNKVAVPEGVAGTPPFWSAIRTIDAVEFKIRAVHNLPISLFDIYGKAWPQQAAIQFFGIF